MLNHHWTKFLVICFCLLSSVGLLQKYLIWSCQIAWFNWCHTMVGSTHQPLWIAIHLPYWSWYTYFFSFLSPSTILDKWPMLLKSYWWWVSRNYNHLLFFFVRFSWNVNVNGYFVTTHQSVRLTDDHHDGLVLKIVFFKLKLSSSSTSSITNQEWCLVSCSYMDIWVYKFVFFLITVPYIDSVF